jgi:hypothetical protein
MGLEEFDPMGYTEEARLQDLIAKDVQRVSEIRAEREREAIARAEHFREFNTPQWIYPPTYTSGTTTTGGGGGGGSGGWYYTVSGPYSFGSWGG